MLIPALLIATVDTNHLKITNGELSFSDEEKVVSHSRQDSFLEQIDFTVTATGGPPTTTVTGSLEKEGGGDLTEFWSDDFDVLDCTGPVCTVDLTAFVGTDTSPAAAFVYILQSDKTTLVANTSWPANTVEHIRIASLVLQSAATTGIEGVLMNRNWNDMSFGITNPKGGNIISNERMRKNHAQWDSGVVLSITGSGTGTVTLATTAGVVYQLNPQVFPVLDMAGADNIHLVNLSGSEFSTSVNLVADITTLANGSTSLGNNKYFNLVIWGVQNRTGETSHLMCNLPIGQYGKQGDATIDAEKFSVHTIPDNFRGTGFLIAELTFQFISGPTWTLIQNKDLLGQFPILIPGGGTTNNITTFVDSAFEVFDNLDDTKRIAFQASSVGSGNTRVITMPDADIDLTLLTATPGTAAAGKALIVSDPDKNIAGLGSVGMTGDLTMSGVNMFLGDASHNEVITLRFTSTGGIGNIFWTTGGVFEILQDVEFGGSLDVGGPVDFDDTLHVQEGITLGQEDATAGMITIFAETDTGGKIIVHVEGDSDTTIASYNLQTFEDDFYIGSVVDTDMLKFIAGTSIQSTVPFDVDAAFTATTVESDGAVTGTSLSDGTATLSGGNLTDMGNITGTDVDITAGTGDYLSSGTLGVGAITATSIDTPTGRTATLVVAASDSTTLAKNQVDFICDGTADEVQINAAFSALPATGGTVYLASGNYEIAAAISIPSNGTLQGEGTATIITLASASNVSMIVNGGTDNITIRDIALDGDSANQTADFNHAIKLLSPNNAIINNVHIEDSKGYGLFVTDDDKGSYTNVISVGPAAAGNSQGGINIQGGGNGTYIAFCEAKDSLFVNSSRGYGIWIEGVNLTMIGCTATNNSNDNLVLRNASDVRIYGGKFSNSLEKGSHISDVGPGFNHNIVFEGTIFDDNFKGGIKLDATTENITFIGCDFTDNGSTSSGDNFKGVDLRGTGHIFNNCHIDNNGNGAAHSGHGVSFATASSFMTFTNSTFTGNGNDGMLMAGDKHIVSNCKFSANTDNGMRILGGTPDLIKITNSTFFNNGDIGLDLRTVTNSIISENHFYDDQGTRTQKHLFVSGGGTGVTVIDNQFGLAESGVVVSGPEAAVPTYRNNSGYQTENGDKSGAVATGGTIAHGLIATPTIVSVTPATSGVADLNIAVDATNITVTFTGGGSEEFFWTAKVDK